MKTMILSMTALILLAATAPAADAPATKPAAPKGSFWGQTLGMGTYEDLYKACEFTPEQQKKIQALEEAKSAAIAKSQTDRETALAHWRKAQESKDEKDIAKAIEEFNNSGATINDSYGKTEKGLLEIMTASQKAKWQQYRTLKMVKMNYANVKLTDAQWDKIMELYDQFARDKELTATQLVAKINAKIPDILTAEQKLQRVRASWQYKQMSETCHFTDEQWQKIAKIQEDLERRLIEATEKAYASSARLAKAIADAQAAGDAKAMTELQQQSGEVFKPLNKLYTQAMEDVQSLLTEKQKKDWQEFQKTQPDRVGPGTPATGGAWTGGQK